MQIEDETNDARPPAYPGAPRWVRVSGIVGALLVISVLVLLLANGDLGRHGPGRHSASGVAGGEPPAQPDGRASPGSGVGQTQLEGSR